MILIKILFIAIFSLCTKTTCKAETNPSTTIVVETSLGQVKGLQKETRLGEKFWAFRSVRYAEAPVNELRFQNPIPVKAWKPEIYDATLEGPICPQSYSPLSIISEDCLRLNVYTKDIKAHRPVIIYLSHGGFYFHGAIPKNTGPENFMERDIVLVTLNFRLGTLGFLATGTAAAAGNMGLKDQVMALRWVQQHIDKFGGDPNSVTLWGYGSGAVSIGLHMMSPMSKGLFHKAIMMSGSPLGQMKYETNQLDLAEKQARLLQCPEKPVEDMVACLKKKPMVDIINTTTSMFELSWNPLMNWKPVIENHCSENQERFLVEDPFTTMSKGDFQKVPLIMGLTEYAFYYMSHRLSNDTIREYLNQDFPKYSPIFFLYERDTPKSLEATTAIRSYYLQNKTIEFPQSVETFAKMYADSSTGFKYYRFLQLASKHVPVYTYLFTYKGRYSIFVDPDTKQPIGAMDHDELLYLFYNSGRTPLFTKTDPENDMIERLTRLCYEFAKKSDPNNASDDYLKSVTWPLYSEDKKQYLEIGEDLNIKSNGFYEERYKFWDNLFPYKEMLNPVGEQCKA